MPTIPDSHKGRTAEDAASGIRAPETGCDCIAQFNEQLKQQGLRVNASLPLYGEPSVAIIETYYPSKPPRGGGTSKAPIILAKYCPFCGKAYPVKKEAADASH